MFGVSAPGAGATRGPVWNNAAPQQYIQQSQVNTPTRSLFAPQRQPLAFGPASASRAPQISNGYNPDAGNAFTYGRGGSSGNGEISFGDHARVQADLSKQLYEAAYAKAQHGEFPMGWQLENMRAKMNLDAQEAATGQSASYFTRPTFAPQWEQYNEQLHELRAMGGDYDLESALPASLRGQNTGVRWRGFQATPIGTSFGGGINVEPGGGYERNISNIAPLDPNRPTAFSNPYNNGDLRSAHDYGSYNSPLLRSGADDHFAVANIHPYQGGAQSEGLSNEVSGQLLPRGYSSLQPLTPQLDPRGHSDWEEGDDSAAPRLPEKESATQSGEIEIHRDSGGMYYQFPDGRKQYMAPQSYGGTVLPMEYSAPFNVQRSGHGIQSVISPHSANNITQGQLDAYYGYYGRTSTSERANIMNSRPTYFDRE